MSFDFFDAAVLSADLVPHTPETLVETETLVISPKASSGSILAPEEDASLADADFEAFAQLLVEPSDEVTLTVVYAFENDDGDGDGIPDDDIIVTGTRRKEWDPSGGVIITTPIPPVGDIGGGGGGSSEQDARDAAIEAKVTIDDSVPAEQRERAEEAEKKTEERMKELDKKIQALSDTEIIRIGDEFFTGAEIKAIWDNLSFTITQNLEQRAHIENGKIYADLDFVESRSDLGMNHLLLHEAAHEIT